MKAKLASKNGKVTTFKHKKNLHFLDEDLIKFYKISF
jgi:hypothetical protein